MNISTKLVFKAHVFLALALAVASASAGSAVDGKLQTAAVSAEKVQHWTALSGTVGGRWNRELARDIGLVLGTASGRYAQLSWYEHEMFNLRQAGSLELGVRNGNLRGFIGGALQAAGGHIIDTPARRNDLSDFRLVPRRVAGGIRPCLISSAPTARPGSLSTA